MSTARDLVLSTPEELLAITTPIQWWEAVQRMVRKVAQLEASCPEDAKDPYYQKLKAGYNDLAELGKVLEDPKEKRSLMTLITAMRTKVSGVFGGEDEVQKVTNHLSLQLAREYRLLQLHMSEKTNGGRQKVTPVTQALGL